MSDSRSPRLRLRWPRAALALTAVVALALPVATAPAASALGASIPATIVASGCSSSLSWRAGVGDGKVGGYYPGYKPHGDGGTVKYCTWKYRLKDSDSAGDYYIAEITSSWSENDAASNGFTGRSGAWAQRITSSATARSNVYSATPSYSRKLAGCGTKFNVGYSFAGFSISLPQEIGCSTTVSRTVLSTTSARWSNPSVTRMEKSDLSYSQKVSNGTVPKFTFTTSRPGYTYSWSTVKQTRGSATWTGYKPSSTRTSLSWTSIR